MKKNRGDFFRRSNNRQNMENEKNRGQQAAGPEEEARAAEPQDIEISDDFASEEAEAADAAAAGAEASGEKETDGAAEASEENRIASLEEQLAKEKKEYLFLMAEFDNFRKRTLKEKSEIIRNAGENVLKGLLPIIDDFERGLKATADSTEATAVREGMELIYNKLVKYLAQNGVKEFDPEERDFDADRHEAVAMVPVADESQKGKILDTVEKGYMINDKVLRHAKVVVGQA